LPSNEVCHDFAQRSSTLAGGKDTSSAQPIRVGRETRRWRLERGLTLMQVGERSGLNFGYLSQIENDKALPSLEALAAIAAALDIPPAWLLLDSASAPRVVFAADRPRTPMPNGGELSEVDAGTSRDLCILEASVPAGGGTGVHAHSGDEHHVVLSGRWRLTQGEHVAELGPGDYLAWDPTVPHDVENVGDEPGRLLVIYPRHTARQASRVGDEERR
jgi:transcriptional regulator with XRE-family HTH domain